VLYDESALAATHMQQIEPASPSLRQASQERTRRFAWITLLCFSALFLALVSWATYTGRQFYLSAIIPRDATVIVRGPTEWVSWQPAGRSVFQGVGDQQVIGQGDSVRIVTKASYGQIASIRLFDESQLDLWAGADLRLERIETTRWSDRLQEVQIRQSGGYVRYDVRTNQPYKQVHFQVLVGNTILDLAPGGSYSVDLRPSDRVVQALPNTQIQPFIADVAVRSGTLTVHSTQGNGVVVLGARERVEIDQVGSAGLPVPARWELIRDGSFSLFSEEEYNNTTRNTDFTLKRSDSWEVYGTPPLPVSQQGFFRLASICNPHLQINDDSCATIDHRTAAWFYRTGGQTSGFTTGIRQSLGRDGSGVDISEYRTLTFSLWTRVIDQSLEDVGDRGSECPVMIRFLARHENPDDPDQERVVCIYTDANDQPPRVQDSDVLYYKVQKGEWTLFNVNLRDAPWLPDYRYLQGIQIYANGHDYNSLVAEVSLIGEQ
jgi:hypothetical protein